METPLDTLSSAVGRSAAGWDSVAATGRRAVAAAEQARLTAAQRRAFEEHEAALRESLEQGQRLNYLVRRGAEIVAVSSLVALIVIAYGASRVAGHLSRQMSRPIDELVEWTPTIQSWVYDMAKGTPE